MASRVDDFASTCRLQEEEISKDEAAGRITAGTAAALRLQVEVLEKLYRTALAA